MYSLFLPASPGPAVAVLVVMLLRDFGVVVFECCGAFARVLRVLCVWVCVTYVTEHADVSDVCHKACGCHIIMEPAPEIE